MYPIAYRLSSSSLKSSEPKQKYEVYTFEQTLEKLGLIWNAGMLRCGLNTTYFEYLCGIILDNYDICA